MRVESPPGLDQGKPALTDSSAARRLAIRVWGVACLAAVALAMLRFWRLRNYLDFTDEDDNIVLGWLLTKGERVYSTIFFHHPPLAFALAHAVAWVSPTAAPAYFRVLPFLAYVAVSLSLVRSPLARGKPGEGLPAAAVFLAVGATVLPLFWGHMVLADVFWGAAFAVLLVRFLVPFVLLAPVSRLDALLAGAAFVLSVSGSLIAVYPLALCVLWTVFLVAISTPHRDLARLRWRSLLGGAVAVGLAHLTWVIAFASVRGLFEQVVLANLRVFARYNPDRATPVQLLTATVRDWVAYVGASLAGAELLSGLEAVFLLLSLATLPWMVASSWRLFRAGLTGRAAAISAPAFLAAVLVFTRMRGGDFHGLPYYISVLALAALLFGETLAGATRVRSSALTLFLAAVVVFALVEPATHYLPLSTSPSAKSTYPPLLGPAAEYVRQRTAPDERVAAFPQVSLFYLLADRRPVHDILCLPWSVEWEAGRRGEPDTLQRLQAKPPRFVFLVRQYRIWNRWAWSAYAAPIDRFLKERYAPVEGFGGFLLELRPLASADGASR